MKFSAGHNHHFNADKTSTSPKEEGVVGENFLQAVWPMLVFVVVYQILLWMLEKGLQYANLMLQEGGAPARVLTFQCAHAADYRALMAALGMSLSLLLVLRLCCRPGEIGFTRHLGAPWQKLFLTALSVLCAAVVLNVFISQAATGGFSEGRLRQAVEQTAAGVENAQRQTGSVTLWVGIAVYGFLTPLAEECIFRGITMRRLYKVILLQRMPQGEKEYEVGREKEGVLGEDDAGKRARLLAAVLSSLFFGLYHGNVAQGIYAACMGLAFCRMLEIAENLGVIVLLHGAVNVAVLLLERSGGWNSGYQSSFLAVLLGVALCSAAAAHRWTEL